MYLKINRLAAGILLLIAAAALLFVNIFLTDKAITTDTVKVGEIINRVEESGGDLNGFDFYNGYDFIVINPAGEVLYPVNAATQKMSVAERKNDALKNNVIITEVSFGYIFIDPGIGENVNNEIRAVKLWLNIFIILLILLLFFYCLYLYSRMVKPFGKMKSFAGNIAAGNFDVPLKIGRYNYFGAFTESFDIMREELKKAEERANAAEKSKKELVAQLSHDIKTPLSSIKAVAEVMTVGAPDKNAVKKFDLIITKANEIDRLISDLFSHTLDELTELKVNCVDAESSVLNEIITQTDVHEKIKFSNPVPGCLIRVDLLRLRQVFDNIISNSYKYAGTDIEVGFSLSDKLNVTVRDFGGGVAEEELPLIANKFYRGSNAQGLSGSGLGLNIASNFMAKMGGAIEFANIKGGFEVKIFLALS